MSKDKAEAVLLAACNAIKKAAIIVISLCVGGICWSIYDAGKHCDGVMAQTLSGYQCVAKGGMKQ